MFTRVALTLAAAVLAVTGPAALAPTTTTPAAADTNTTLTVGITEDIDSLNPFLSETVVGTDIGRLMYDFLTAYSPVNQTPVAGLATKWVTSPDKLTWTYTIRSGVKWSDGQPLTARDIAFTYNLMMTNSVAATANGNFVQNFASVTAPDATTLVITTKTPQATMLALDVPIVPQHIWAGVKDIQNYTNLPTPGHPVVGDGPFILTGYKQGQYVQLTANKNFWRGAPKINELNFLSFDNTDAAVQALKKGDIDLVSTLTAAQFNALKGQPDITVNQAEGARFAELEFNPGAATDTGAPIGDGNPALKDVAVRQAIADAIDVNTIVKQVYGGYAQAATGYIPYTDPTYHWTPPPGVARTFDIAAANKLLDQAGYPMGAGGVRDGKDGKPLTLRLFAENNRVQDGQTAPYIVGWLKQIGITVQVQEMSMDKTDQVVTSGDYDMAFSNWTVNPDPDYVLSIQTCAARPTAAGQSGSSDAFFCDPQYDQLYQAQESTFDSTARATIIDQMQQILYQQAPVVTLAYPNSLEAYRSDRFAPFTVQPQPGGAITNQNGYWSYLYATPLATASGGGVSTVVIVVVVVVVIVAALLVAWLVRRRKQVTADDRE